MNADASSSPTNSAADAVPLSSLPSSQQPFPPQPDLKPVAATILVIENNVPDIDLLALALKQSALPAQIYPVLNLAAAQNYLLGTGSFADRKLFPQPYLIIANSRFPTGSVSELIIWIRHHPTLRFLPIIIQSGHDTPEQRAELYQHGANFCLPRTNDPAHLAQQLLSIQKILQRP